MSTSMQSSTPLSNHSSPESGHLDSTSSHDSPEQNSGVIYQVKTLAARFGFFSPDSLKTVSTFINVVPTEVTALLQIRSTSLFRQSLGVNDRSLAFQNGIKYMAYNPESKWTTSLQEVAMGHLLLQPSLSLTGESTIPSTISRNLPAAQDVYRLLLQFEGNGSRADHPYGVSSLVFAFASLISLSIHPPTSMSHNQSSCFDLSPLYGFTPDDANKIRLNDGTGMLAPDCFFEDRVTLLPPAVSAMLIIWNRNHNFIAKRLSIIYGEKFKDQNSKDEHIFQNARLINCANFRNIIAIDFLKGLMGLSAADPNPNINVLSNDMRAQDLETFPESVFCYNWSSSMSRDDASRLEGTMTRMLGVEDGELANIQTAQLQNSLQLQTSEIDNNRTRRDCPELKRQFNGRFKDEDIAEVLQQATKRPACAFGCRQVPLCAQDLELQKIKAARESNVRSLNEYRKCLGLKPHKTFLDWNSNVEVATHAEQLYKDIDNLELYVGLHAEDAVPCGFGFGYTMTYGLLTDLVSRIRSDLANAKIAGLTVTPWGYQDCQIHLNNGAFGNVFPKILMRNLPRHYPHNNVHTIFPFCIPSSAVECLTQNSQLPDGIEPSDYDRHTPKQSIVHTLTTKAAISYVLNAPEIYNTPYGERFKKITDGYGYFLGFDDETLHDQDQIMTLHALLPDSESTLRRYATTMSTMTQRAIISKRNSSIEGYTIDIVKDVINPVCIQWVCQTLCDYQLRCDKPGSGQAEDTKHMNEEEMHEAFGALYTYVFRNSDPEQAWDIHQKAMKASKILRDHVRTKIPRPKWLEPSSYLWRPWFQTCINDFLHYVDSIREEFSPEGRKLPQFSAQTFLERLVQARRNLSIGDLHPSLDEIHKRVHALHWASEDDLKGREFEVSRIVANVLGLAVVTSVNFPMALIQAIDFYMDDKRKEERAEIIRLSNLEFPSAKDNDKLMGYIREAQRIDQPLGLWRDVTRDDDIQGSNGLRMRVHRGDRIFVDLQKLHGTPTDIDKNRKTPSIQGLGLHKCPALSFIDKTMPEMFKIIFQLPSVRRGPGGTGKLIKTKCIADPIDSDPIVFVNQAKELSFLPQNLILEYDADPRSIFGSDEAVTSEKEQQAWKRMTSVVSQHEVVRQRMDWGLRAMVIGRILWTLLTLLLSLQAALFGMWRTKKSIVRPVNWEDVKHQDIQCPEPIKVWHNWEAATMAAGQQGVPELNYTSNNSTAHRLSVYDVDKRDMRMAIYVDDILRGLTTDFDLDLEEDCGLDVHLCYQKGFSAGWLVVPAGEHQVSIQWNGKEFVNGTHEPDLGKNTTRRLFWERVDCAS